MRFVSKCLLVAAVFGLSQLCHAHFLWVKLEPVSEGYQATMFFSEAADVEGAHLPDAVANATLWVQDSGGRRKLALNEASDNVPAKVATLPAVESRSVSTTCRYGNYHGSLLTYYAKAVHATDAQNLAKASRDENQKLDIATRYEDGAYQIAAYWDGEPLSSLELTIRGEEGQETKVKTGKDGFASFRPKSNGVFSVLAHHEEKSATGEIDGEEYSGAHHYASLTVNLHATKSLQTGTSDSQANESRAESNEVGRVPDLPTAIASFGAAVLGDYVYVYGGHTGTAHTHSRENLSDGFYRMDLRKCEKWEKLDSQQPLQGLALVAHGKYLYRVGGLDARNSPDEDDDLHSVSTAARFNTETLEWEALPDLPAGRSSHDAYLLGDQLFVVGGWKLAGDADGEWQSTVLSMNLNAETLTWMEHSNIPFFKRALAVAVNNDRLFAICGMNDDNDVDRSVYVLDPIEGWSEGPELKGDGMDGFGVSACTLDGRLFMSGLNGNVYTISDDGMRWEKVGKLESGRFFHRLVPHGDRLLAIGGASHTGHVTSIEFFEPALVAN